MKVRVLGCDRDTVRAVQLAAARRRLELEVSEAGGGSGPANSRGSADVVLVAHDVLVTAPHREAVASCDDHLIVAAPAGAMDLVESWLAAAQVDDVIMIPTNPDAVAVRLMAAIPGLDHKSTRSELAALRIVRSIEHSLAAARSPEEVAKTAIELLREPIGFTYGSVQVFDFADDKATVLATTDGEGPNPEGSTMDLTTFGISFELLQGRSQVISDLAGETATDNGVVAALAAAGYRGCAHLPLVGRDTLIGSLLLASHDPDSLRRARLALAEEVSHALAISIHDSKLLAAVERLAVTDVLTGLLTRRHLFELGGYEIQRARRYERLLAAVMIDIDHFKSVNDRHGHRVGDVVLAAVADRCRGGVRDVDLIGRYGGEEFVLLLPETDLEGALLVAERVRASIEESTIEGAGAEVRVTISAGVTTLAPGDGDLEALLARADQAMYAAKESGRNRTVAKPG